MVKPDIHTLAHHLKQERLYVASEKQLIQRLNNDVLKTAEKLYQAAWIAKQQRINLDRLILTRSDLWSSPAFTFTKLYQTSVFKSRMENSIKTQFLSRLLQQSAVLSWLVLLLIAVWWAVLKKWSCWSFVVLFKDIKVKCAFSMASSDTSIFAYTLIAVSLLVLVGGSEAEMQEEMSSKQIIHSFVNPSLRRAGTYACTTGYHRWVYKVKFKWIES